MDKLTPQAVLFDLGSTLIEYPSTIWEEVSAECVAHARDHLVDMGHQLPEAEVFFNTYREIRDEHRKTAADTLVEWNVLQVARRLLARVGVETIDGLDREFFDAYYEKVKPHVYAMSDAVEVLTRIRERYSAVGLISNTVFPEETHLDEMQRFEIAEYFDFTIFSSTFGMRKPHPDIFYQAANQAGFAPGECVYIGDRYVEDVTGPQKIGMSAILRRHEGRDYPEPLSYNLRVVESLSELSEHFDF